MEVDFIVNNFPKIFTSGITDIMDLKLVPYGNAMVGENNTIICQHGHEECLLNQVEACAIHLELQYANETSALIPSHQYVPWVAVNKVPLYDNYDNFVKAVCNAYKGTPPPRVCNKPTTDINHEAKSNSNQEVCYVNEASPNAKVKPPGTTWRLLMKF
ncbi:gamma-interferon-responsive lysosomal thiol protein-like [Papaver somniferum]|uniref:gamma-interferon-responsive lysosomal thiol protein-like n=1 Tax=Papaver somniferum TaxID=3469 RepID=UPI000E6FB0AE|nr:gamma-interferon-responsive lysosomal thiol protein-like [Papaver somniferum]